MNVNDAKAYIFDVDGTLYNLKKVQFNMLLRLLGYYCLRPWSLKELYAIYLFRRYRERAEYQESGINVLCKMLSKEIAMPASRIEKAIDYWMFKVPLDLVKKYSYVTAINFIQHQQELGKIIAIYSDYPATDKLKQLGIKPDYIFVPNCDDDNIRSLKPSPQVMKYIISRINVDVKNIVYVGDRDDKDAKGAASAGIQYYDIKLFNDMLLQER